MMDIETESLWGQIRGESIQGDMKDNKLRLFNSAHTTYAKFKEMFPEGKLLVKPEKGEAGSHYEKYFASEGRYGIFGRSYKYDRIGQKDLVYGLRLPCKTAAVTQKYLEQNNSVVIKCDDVEYQVSYDKVSKTVNAVNKKDGNAVPVLTSFWFAWINFFPATELIYLEK